SGFTDLRLQSGISAAVYEEYRWRNGVQSPAPLVNLQLRLGLRQFFRFMLHLAIAFLLSDFPHGIIGPGESVYMSASPAAPSP
ncbi:hypothetical protein LNK15_14550, partial [Jeotgalicoccus huakuii]|nr:hypothetical protein [Jeotgalicoccus huakuii]